MNLNFNTSLRGRGKWGDFLVAVLPLSWCANILLNSNFILRMFEWQNESSLFTVRIHGKQWYWIYKFDIIDAIDILTAPKNIGRNRWVIGTPQELVVCESYLQAMQLRSQADWLSLYWRKRFEDGYTSYKHIELTPTYTSIANKNNNSNDSNFYYNYDEVDDTWDTDNNIKHQVSRGPVRLTKHMITQDYLRDNTDLLKFNFFDTNDTTASKVPHTENHWVLKQKRYKKRTFKNPVSSKDVEYSDFETIRNIYKKQIIENIKLITDLEFVMDPYSLYKCIRNNRHRSESLPLYLYRRLLRTKRTLVLPAHVNMTVVTNSYDIVHSWFLPGLGIKMDCVPGRSTHHSLYLDNIGFYYGQCAEICGRYHHHMPIRLCALPFEHFLVWWEIKGLPKILRLKKNKSDLVDYSALKFAW